eukprot:371636-Rhodomonas_salina.2
MSGTALGYPDAAMGLHAMSGTELGYAATNLHAMSGTELGSIATGLHAMSSTDVGYPASRWRDVCDAEEARAYVEGIVGKRD